MPTKAISRLSKTDLLVFMLIFAVIGGIAIFRSFAATQATTYYVATTGSDSNAGTLLSTPLRTIQAAANKATSGDTVIVADGVYTESVTVPNSGNTSNFITFKSQNKWGAVLDGANNTLAKGFVLNGTYIKVQDFEIRNYGNSTQDAAGVEIFNGGDNSIITGNNIHDIGRQCTNTTNTNGLVGVFIQGNDVTVEQNYIHDIGRFRDGESGCANPASYTGWQTHDHGIYMHDGTNNTILNNIFYNFARGWAVQVYPGPVSNLSILNNTFSGGNPNRNNTLITTLGTAVSNSTISNNIFYNGSGSTSQVIDVGGATFTAVTFNNNLTTASSLYWNSNSGSTTKPSGITETANLVAQNATSLFTNPNNPPSGYAINTTSPAYNAGASLVTVTNDYAGVSRPQGGFFDIGAYEKMSVNSGLSTQGDLNGDNVVNIFDLSILLSHYGQSGQTASNGDLNNDAIVNIFDLSILLSNYGKTGGGVSCAVSTQHVPDGPDGMGGCWPGASNTGPNAPESSMTASSYSGSNCTVNSPNVTIDSQVVNCKPLYVGPNATGLLIKNAYLKGGVIQQNGTTASFTIQDSLLDNNVPRPACSGGLYSCAAGLYACGDLNNQTSTCGVDGSNFTILRTEIVHTIRAAYCQKTCTIQDNYFHDTNMWPDKTNLSHGSSVRNEQYLTLKHNSLACDFSAPGGNDPSTINGDIGCSADMSGYPDFAPIMHDTIDSNLFIANPVGFYFCAYGGYTQGDPKNPKPYFSDPTNATYITFINNIFQKGANDVCGTIGGGPIVNFNSSRTGNVWTNNKYDDGTVVPAVN